MSDSNKLKTAWARGRTIDYARIPLGLWDDASIQHKFGRNNALNTSTLEDIWITGGTYTWPTEADVLNVFSDNVGDDNSGGAGARSIRIFGLDTDFFEINEIVTLAGSDTVVTSQSFRRVNFAFVHETGT